MRRAPVVTGSALPRGAPFARRLARGESPRGPACRPGLLLQRHAAFQGGLQASELLEDLDRALKDRPLDPGKFLTDPGVGLAGAGRLSPAAHHAPGLRSISREVRATATTSTDRP